MYAGFQRMANPTYQPLPSTGYPMGPMSEYQTSPIPQYQPGPNVVHQGPNPVYQAGPWKNNNRPVNVSQTSSTSVNNSTYTEVPEPRQHSKGRRGKWTWHIFSHLISFLWLAPIAALLALNFQRHIVGASVWCPMGKCSSHAFDEDAIRKAGKLDRDDHNALGALQFVAKALEIWFLIIATTFVYDVAMMFASKGGGLPVGYLLTHLEFSDVRNIVNPLMWTSPVPHRGTTNARNRSRTIKLYFFAVLATFLTILVNLMGPATAVLVLPTLQWIDMPHEADQIFNGTGSDSAPYGNSYLFPGCTSASLLAKNYSCTYDVYGASMDAWANAARSSQKQSEQAMGRLNLGVSQEAAYDFTLNISTSNEVIWVPNRQVLRSFSIDLHNLALDIFGASDGSVKTTPVYNNSLSTILQRSGPSIALNTNCFQGNITAKVVDHNRYVICLSGWTVDYVNFYTKCLRSLTGWNPNNLVMTFTLANENPKKSGVDVTSMFSDKATFFNQTTDFGSGIRSCMGNDTTKACDWDKIFDTDLPQPLRNTSRSVGTTIYETQDAPHSDALVWCEQVAYLGFPTYQFDTSATSASNVLRLVQLINLTNPTPEEVPLVVNPAWFLAAWSIKHNDTVDSSRPMAKELTRIVPNLFTPWNYTNLTSDQSEFFFLHTYAIGQAMSMINYYFDNATAPDGSVPKDDAHPILHHWATLHVWAFGLSSRTSRLGVAVVLAGSLCVLMHLVLGIWNRAHNHSPVELFVAALEHQHQHEFHGLEDEKEWARVRYSVSVHDRKPTFRPDRNHHGTPHVT